MRRLLPAVLMLLAAAAAPARAAGPSPVPVFPNATGASATLSTAGFIDATNPFFRALGTNGRSCNSCHRASDGWSISPRTLRQVFDATRGTDPVFRTNDGAVSPNADVSTEPARGAAFAMLLSKGLFRVGIGIPANAEFELESVHDPYGYASAAELSLFRRPLPSANLKFLSTVMWDGRETLADPAGACIRGTSLCFAPLHVDLADQANGATLGHAQAAQALTPEQQQAIVAFETGLYTAQMYDDGAGPLDARGARGGPLDLAAQDAYFGINDPIAGDYRTGAPFDARVMRLYDAWASSDASPTAGATASRQAVARGEALFNSKPIRITGVKGLNDELGVTAIAGTCSTCHNAPGAGNHSVPMPLDIGVADASRATPDLPLYVLRNKASGERIATTDPGRALITGRWKDVGRFKGPTLRSLASRPPYFHNGSAADLGAVVDFYNRRFGIGLTAAEKDDLVAFLRAL